VYLAGIVLALVMVIPTAWFPFQLGKLALFATLALIALVLYIAGGGGREFMRSHGLYGALAVACLPLVYIISARFSADPSVAYLGFGVETDTVLFATLGFLAFLLSFSFFKTLRTVRLLLASVFWALVAAALFQWVAILFGTSIIPFDTFSDRSVNLIGKWNDLGLLVALLSVFLLVRSELTSLSILKKGIIGVSCAALALLLGIINFSLAWALVLACCVVIALIKFIIQKTTPAEDAALAQGTARSWMHRIPWFTAVGALIAIVFLFFGSAFNTRLTSIFPVSSLEVRPSYSSTLSVINDARGGSFERVLFGTGPNTFGRSWLLHKPAEVNQSVFWNLDFNVGFSTFFTALGTVGLLGILAWLIPIFLVLAALVRAIRLSVLTREDKIIATTLGVGSIFLFATVLLYVPSQNIILLAFVLTGATYGFLWRQGQSRIDTQEASSSRIGQMIGALAMIVLLSVVLWSAVASSRRLMAQVFTQRGGSELATQDVDSALSDAARAQKYDRTGDVLRLIVDAGNLQLQHIAADKTLTVEVAQAKFTSIVQETVDAGKAAIAMNPADYRADISLGRVYDFLASLKIQGAYENARTSYESAATKNPSNPAISLALARLEASQGHQQLTSDSLTKALTLKPNYTDAILLVVQLDVANNDIPNAIRAATAAAQTAPGVASIWFQLGLLYYAAGDTKDAIAPLEQAVKLVQDYANAKYFLGLSYYAQNRASDAVKEFQDLTKSNPDSAEVKLILSNMVNGKKPFEGATPPADQPPQTRPTAPVGE
jgi:tetratricopeptide (TPR) repeat protein